MISIITKYRHRRRRQVSAQINFPPDQYQGPWIWNKVVGAFLVAVAGALLFNYFLPWSIITFFLEPLRYPIAYVARVCDFCYLHYQQSSVNIYLDLAVGLALKQLTGDD